MNSSELPEPLDVQRLRLLLRDAERAEMACPHKRLTDYPLAFFVDASEDIVDLLLAMNTKNRTLKQRAIRMYEHEIREGRWTITNQGIGVSRDGVLVDGQNRLVAIKNCGYPPVPLMVVLNLPREAQYVVDMHTRRSGSDIFRIHMDATVQKHLPASLRILMRDADGWKTGKPYTNNDLIAAYERWGDEVVCVMNGTQTRIFASPHYAAFAWHISDGADEKDICDFARMAAEPEMLRKTHPAYTLNRYVLGDKGRGGSDRQRERFLKTLRCVYAYRAGDQLGKLYATDPRLVAGGGG